MSEGHRVAFIGLGVMGYPMAGHLLSAGHQVTVYNRTAAKAQQFTAQHSGSSSAATPREAADDCELVFLCVGNDDDVRQVTTAGDGAIAGLAEGATLVDHTTASATVARELDAACRTRGAHFLDAPISGGQVGAETGQLTVMCGGEPEVFTAAAPVIDAYAKATTLIGPVGSGQVAKMVNQICIAGLVQALSEGLHFAKRAGVDPAKVIEAISRGAAQSWQMENRWQTMIDGEFEHGFAVEWMRKDLGIALAQAKACGAHLPVAGLVDQFYSQVEAMGGRRWDTSSLIALLERS